jgi:hypothetical protein
VGRQMHSISGVSAHGHIVIWLYGHPIIRVYGHTYIQAGIQAYGCNDVHIFLSSPPEQSCCPEGSKAIENTDPSCPCKATSGAIREEHRPSDFTVVSAVEVWLVATKALDVLDVSSLARLPVPPSPSSSPKDLFCIFQHRWGEMQWNSVPLLIQLSAFVRGPELSSLVEEEAVGSSLGHIFGGCPRGP